MIWYPQKGHYSVKKWSLYTVLIPKLVIGIAKMLTSFSQQKQ